MKYIFNAFILENDEPIHFNYGKDQKHHLEDNEYRPDVGEKLPLDKDIPVMIWWTPFTFLNETRKCNLGECYITDDRTMQHDNRTRVFLFYGTDFHANDLPLPRRGKKSIQALMAERLQRVYPVVF